LWNFFLELLPEKVVKIFGPALLAIGILGCIIAMSFQEEFGLGVFLILALSGISFLVGLSFTLEYLGRHYWNDLTN